MYALHFAHILNSVTHIFVVEQVRVIIPGAPFTNFNLSMDKYNHMHSEV